MKSRRVVVYMLLHNTLNIYSKVRPSYDIFFTLYILMRRKASSIYLYQRLTRDSTHSVRFLISITKVHERLHSFKMLILYIYAKRLSRNFFHSVIFLTKYANEKEGGLILYIYTKGLRETPPTQKAYSIYLYQRRTSDLRTLYNTLKRYIIRPSHLTVYFLRNIIMR